MGRKKAQRGKIKKRISFKLETAFDCPTCKNEKSVSCKISKSHGKANAYCKVCQAFYECKANNLTNPIDVYHSWCDSVQ